jgi:hypothetical protein
VTRSNLSSSHAPVLTFLVGLQLVLDHTDHDLVRDQTTSVHDLLGFLTQLCLGSDLRSKHVPGSEVADAVLLLEVGGLGSLTCQGGLQVRSRCVWC